MLSGMMLGSKHFLQSYFTGGESLGASLLISEKERSCIIDARGGAGDALFAVEHHNFLPTQDIVVVPSIGEGFSVVALDKLFIGEGDATNESGRETIEIERSVGLFGE